MRHARPTVSAAFIRCLVGGTAVVFSTSPAQAAPDLGFGQIEGLTVIAREGVYPEGANALTMRTTACNVGLEEIPWLAPMAEEHPVVVMHLYRSSDGRFEQVGVSAARHEYFALSNSACSACQNPSDGTFLGVGCSTTSGTGINADRNLLGPRDEIDPFLGTWECTGSLFAGGQPDCVARPHDGDGPLDRRLVVTDVDLAVPGAAFVYEAYWIAGADADRRNSIGSRSASVARVGSNWILSDLDDEAVGPALLRWGGTVSWVSVPGDGELLLASKSWELGGGLHQYEYALFNLDSAREVGEVRIPIGPEGASAVGFHDPDTDPGNDWTAQVLEGTIVWSTDPFEVDPEAPALSYGLLYNFRFVSSVPPVDGEITLVAWRGHPDEVAVAAIVPQGASASAPGIVEAASAFQLSSRPTPARGRCEISFRRKTTAHLDLAVFDATGRLVRNLLLGQLAGGASTVEWDGKDDAGRHVPPGVYYVRLRSGGGNASLRVPLVR